MSSRPWKRPLPPKVIIANASVVDVVHARVLRNWELRLEAGDIVSAGPSSGAAWSDAVVYNVGGRYVLPGLIDVHVHLFSAYGNVSLHDDAQVEMPMHTLRASWAAKEMLHRGFTTVRDCAGCPRSFSDAQEEGLIDAPRIFCSGKAISQTGGHGDFRLRTEDQLASGSCCLHDNTSLARIADGVPACLTATRDELRRGAHFIKVCGTGGGVASPTDPIGAVMFTDEELQAISGTAERYGTYATAHAYTSESVMHAIKNGVRGIEHGNLVDDITLRYMAKHNVSLTPTLVTYYAFARNPDRLTPDFRHKNQQVMNAGLECLRRAHDAGVTIALGTDLLSDFQPMQPEEFSLRASVLPAWAVLQQATCNAAHVLRQEGRLGTLDPGARADVIVLAADAANPLESVDALVHGREHAFDLIFQAGRVVFERNTSHVVRPAHGGH